MFLPVIIYARLTLSLGVGDETLAAEDSRHDFTRLVGAHKQAITRPLPHRELAPLQLGAAQAQVSIDLAGQGHDLACAARRSPQLPCGVLG